jgi:queuine tRNA-ribosyltransferase
MSFSIVGQDVETPARAGMLKTAHGEVETPVFMPVATQASVKALSQEDLESLGTKAILSNSYHLYLRPGTSTIKEAGGLHRFMGYNGMILTDSGGFQVFSQSDLRKIDDDGVSFKSHIDGSAHRLTPEKVIEIQSELGSDCWTALDECSPYPSDEAQTEKALSRTMHWLDLSQKVFLQKRAEGSKALFFPILQGGFFPQLRLRAAEHMATIAADGISLGGFSVGEPKNLTWEILGKTIERLPKEKPRYLMGVGTPEDLWNAVALGVDMMDCVWPTRVARNGQVMIRAGRYNIGTSVCRRDFEPLEPSCSCFVCQRYSKAYISHLHRSRELLAHRLISYHNIHLMFELAREIRRSIINGDFPQKKRAFFAGLKKAPQLV